MALDDADDPAHAVDELAAATTPWLFGVRHHSPACAVALPPLLDAFQPTAIALELPEDLGQWIEWLGHPEADAPLAVAAVSRSGDDLGFYPFADFSPELVVIRWAREHGVPVHAIDLPSALRAGHDRETHHVGIHARLSAHHDDSWEHLVEGPGTLADPERVRRAALLYGWALRIDAFRGGGVSPLDLAREAFMRDAIGRLLGTVDDEPVEDDRPAKKPTKKAAAKPAPVKSAKVARAAAPAKTARASTKQAESPPASKAKRGGARVAAIIGSFHAAALLPRPTLWQRPAKAPSERVDLVSSLIPYGFELLDERSGYPAGIRDPAWQQRLFQTQRERGDVGALVAQCLVEITRGVRQRGLPASVADARAAAEVAQSLASLRGLATPGRRELVEGVQTALTHGELMGRGRVVARAMELVLVGHHRGHLAPGTPRSGLAPHVFAVMDELRLPRGVPTPMTEPEDLRLDPLRSKLDRRRHVALSRMRACGIPYATEQESMAIGGVESLSASWRLLFTPSTEAVIELAGLRGVTLRQAAMGALRAEHGKLVADDKLTAVALVALTESAAEAGIGELVREWLLELTGPRLAEATLAELIALIALVDRIVAGHIVGLPTDAEDAIEGELDVFEPPPIDRGVVISIAVASILGLAGSESLDDARALAELVRVLERPEHLGLGEGRLRWSVDQLVATGTPVIAGAAAVVQVLIGTRTPEALSITIGGWLDVAVTLDTRRALADRLRGAIAVAGPLFESAPVFLDGLVERVEQLADGDFLPRVAALREGFETLSTASRARLLRALGDRLGEGDARGQGLDVELAIPAQLLAAAAEADRAGRQAIAKIPRPELVAAKPAPSGDHAPRAIPEHGISVRDRWRMILGHEREQMQPQARRAARALDELYGAGHGEGSRAPMGAGGGKEDGFPTVRAWRDEIEDVFGESVFEEVAAKAAVRGRVGALLELDPDQVSPSVELLEQVLSLKGGLGEAHLGRLRAIIRRVVDELVRELAVRVRPAMQGAISPRATRRQTGVLHLGRTVGANLARAQIEGDRVSLVPERLFFKTRSRRHMDWHVVLVVDVSGSMEPSVIYSAMMAAILSAVPWIGVRFITFSTEVIDLSEHAADPLALLLEVNVGGGTHIAKGLRYARSLVTVPQRTIVICVSDFEEGFAIENLLGEVRSLVEAGVKCLGLAALDDRGAPRYAVPIAEQIVAAGMPIAALTPVELARWIGEQIR
ncbi:MAG TPA: DUF5682 family protein [Kofleriaceae bacterium]|nr:DUF5682 family protein [Kofleriaceae bacterium]